jgi:hypothetical protein
MEDAMPARKPARAPKMGAKRLEGNPLERALAPFRPMFTKPTWANVLVLTSGALLAIRRRTTTQALRAMDLTEGNFSKFHRVLSKARWSPLQGSKILLDLIVAAFVPRGEVVVAIDETIERRRGAKIDAKGIYRDAVRSSKGFFVKTTGLRWISLMVLAPIPWAKRVWALPFLTVLAPSEKWAERHGRRHKTIAEWARQALLQTARWLPGRKIVAVGDGAYGSLPLFHALRGRVTLVARVNAKARFFDPPAPRRPGARGRPAKIGSRQPTPKERLEGPTTSWTRVALKDWGGVKGAERVLEAITGTALWHTPKRSPEPVPVRWVVARDPNAPSENTEPWILASTDPDASAEEILSWYSRRWAEETTIQGARLHLGVETQRQWSDKAIARTTPALFGLFSLVALMAHELRRTKGPLTHLVAAWSRKEDPTFADALAAVRRSLWAHEALRIAEARRNFSTGRRGRGIQKVPRPIEERLTELICWAA